MKLNGVEVKNSKGRKPVKKKKLSKFSAFSVITAILILMIVGFIIGTIANSRPYKYEYTEEVRYILRELDDGRYEEAIRDVASNRAQGVGDNKSQDHAQVYAAADYAYAESMYVAAVSSGNDEKAAQFKACKDEAYGRMGQLQYMAEEINESFEAAVPLK